MLPPHTFKCSRRTKGAEGPRDPRHKAMLLRFRTRYHKRFGPWFVEPVVAGLKDDKTPFLCAMDLIGAPVSTAD